jgi:hypothetical protein
VSRRPPPRRSAPTRRGSEALSAIDAPFVDARASDLTLALGEEAKPALLVRRLEGAGFELELRVLGCSHQVMARRTGPGPGAELSEVVACLPGRREALPAHLVREGPAERYDFASRVLSLEPRAHARCADELLAAVEPDGGGLVGVFPGLVGALTALRCRAREGGIDWMTWHTYPQTGEVVETRTRLRWVAS